jgi:hypothetical protein
LEAAHRRESSMPTELIHLELSELSLVPKGANQMAKAPIFKSDTSDGETMTDEVTKMSPEMDKKIKAYMKAKDCDRKTAETALMKSFDDIEALKVENERLRKGFIDEGYVIRADTIEKKAPDEFIEVDGEQINKADVPAPILKRMETAEAELKAQEITKKAKETLPNFKEDVAVKLMKFDLDEDIMQILLAADKLFEGMTDEVGKQDAQADMTDPQEKMDALVKEYSEEHNVTKAQAYAELSKTDIGKALVKDIYKKD